MVDHAEWKSRTELLIGKAGVEKLLHAHVLVAGLGGVGAAAAEMLCRAGVGKLTLADSDVITAANRNRQLPALCSTEGKKKAEVVAGRLLDINPELKCTAIVQYVKDETTIALLSAAPYDYVVDAIDTLSPKAYFIFHAMRLGLKVVSSMGSGARMDPSQIQIADISQTHHCTFAYDIRKRLRRLGLETGVRVVFSPEPPIKEAVTCVEGEKNKKSLTGTISYMPVIFGCYCASEVIRDLLKQSGCTKPEKS